MDPLDLPVAMPYSERKARVAYTQLMCSGQKLLEKVLWLVLFWGSDKMIIMLISGLCFPESEPKNTYVRSLKYRFRSLVVATVCCNCNTQFINCWSLTFFFLDILIVDINEKLVANAVFLPSTWSGHGKPLCEEDELMKLSWTRHRSMHLMWCLYCPHI